MLSILAIFGDRTKSDVVKSCDMDLVVLNRAPINMDLVAWIFCGATVQSTPRGYSQKPGEAYR